jgi:hypothetical protein
MMEKFDTFLIFWNKWIIIPSILLGFFGVISFVFKDSELLKIIKNKKKVGIILIIQMVLFLFTTHKLSDYFENKVKTELITILEKTDLKLEINGKKLDLLQTEQISNEIKNEIKKIGELKLNHPSFLKKMKLRLESNTETLNLSIEQNFDNKTEFIIHSDRYKSTELNPFGGMKSELFRKYFESY